MFVPVPSLQRTRPTAAPASRSTAVALYHVGERRRGQQAEVRRHENGDTCRALGDGGEP